MASVPSANVKSALIETMSDVCAGHFGLEIEADRSLPRAFEVLEAARGRVIADHLRTGMRDRLSSSAQSEKIQRRIAEIQLQLLSGANTAEQRTRLLEDLTATETQLEPLELSGHDRVARLNLPIHLTAFQAALSPDELFLEYVVGKDRSYVLAITKTSRNAYRLADIRTDPCSSKSVYGRTQIDSGFGGAGTRRRSSAVSTRS
jgi:hypothetical protein